jgi:poly [ADP-ribose] polymerase
VIIKGGAPVDQYVGSPASYRVYNDGVKIYSTTLNQSNVCANNNKFYILQVLQNESNNSFIFFTRWGRVGVVGQMASIPCGIVAANAMYQYNKKLREKLNGGYR